MENEKTLELIKLLQEIEEIKTNGQVLLKQKKTKVGAQQAA
jgi:hypothetical protein